MSDRARARSRPFDSIIISCHKKMSVIMSTKCEESLNSVRGSFDSHEARLRMTDIFYSDKYTNHFYISGLLVVPQHIPVIFYKLHHARVVHGKEDLLHHETVELQKVPESHHRVLRLTQAKHG